MNGCCPAGQVNGGSFFEKMVDRVNQKWPVSGRRFLISDCTFSETGQWAEEGGAVFLNCRPCYFLICSRDDLRQAVKKFSRIL